MRGLSFHSRHAASAVQEGLPADPAAASPSKGSTGKQLARLGVVLAALLAGCFAVVMPPFQMPDEHSHFLRAYLISRGQLLAPPDSRVPAAVLAFVQRYPDAYDLWCSGKPFENLWTALPPDNRETPIRPSARQRFLRNGIAATGMYFPLPYLPASAAIWVARRLGAPPQLLMYAARLSSILLFVASLIVATRLAPHWSPLILAVALLPMTLHQAAAVSADIALIAFSLAGFALTMWARDRVLTRGRLAWIAVYFVAWSLCKFSLWCVPLFWVAAARSIGGFAKRAAWTAAVLVIAVTAAVAWRQIDAANMEHFRVDQLQDKVDVARNVEIVTHNPAALVRSTLYSIRVYSTDYIGGFAGKFGWALTGPPPPVRLGYLAVLFFAALTTVPKHRLLAVERAALLATAAMGFGLVCVLLIAYCAPAGFLEHGRAVWGVQGRYFIPFALPGLAVLGVRRVRPTVVQSLVLVAGLVCGAFSIRFAWWLYYV